VAARKVTMEDLTKTTNEKLIRSMLNDAARYGTSASGLCIDVMGGVYRERMLECKKELLRRLETVADNVA